MHRGLLIALTCSLLSFSQSIDLTGTVITNDSLPVCGAVARLTLAGISDSTDSLGKFHLKQQSTSVQWSLNERPFYVNYSQGFLRIEHSTAITAALLRLFDLQGKLLAVLPPCEKSARACAFKVENSITQSVSSHTMMIFQLSLNTSTFYIRVMGLEQMHSQTRLLSAYFDHMTQRKESRESAMASFTDTLIIRKQGYISKRIPITDKTGVYNNIAMARQLSVIDSNLVDVEYSSSLGIFVCVCKTPDRAILFNPLTEKKIVVPLNKPPTCVSVSPDGNSAVIGHLKMITSIDLKKKIVISEYPVSCDVFDIVLAGNDHAYSFSRNDQFESFYCTNMRTRQETAIPGVYQGTHAKLHPSGQYIYGAQNGLSPSHFQRYTINADSAIDMYNSPKDFYGGNIWISEDGSRLYSPNGYTCSFNPLRNLDMAYSGSIGFYISSLSHSIQANAVAMLSAPPLGGGAVISASQAVLFVNPTYLTVNGTLDIDAFIPDTLWSKMANQFVFFIQNGAACSVLFPGEKNEFSIFTINAEQYPKQ